VDIFRQSDLKVFLPGAGAALAMGLMLGGLMQPHLDAVDGRPAGPQMLADWAGARSSGPFDPGTTFAAYHGKTPDYVTGTDWKRSAAWPAERSVAPQREVADDDAAPVEEAPVLSRALYDEPARPAHAYPSLGGRPPTAAAATDHGVDDDTLPSIDG